MVEVGGRGGFTASPWACDGKVYCLSESGLTTVIAAGPEFKVLATNKLDESKTLSSFAVSNNQLFLRTGPSGDGKPKSEVRDPKETRILKSE